MATPARWAGLVTGRGDKDEVKWEYFVELDKASKRLAILLDWKENKANGYRLSVLDDAKLEAFSQWLDGYLAEQNVDGLSSSEVCLSNNRITHVGLDHLLTTLIRRKVGCRIMKLYRNNISDPGMVCLSRYISATREPLHELHLSHNKITARGAATLLRALAAHSGYPRVGRKGKLVPLWLRLEQNEITQVNKLMVFIHSKGVAFCTEKNRDLCGPSKCRHATSTWSPLVHLYVIDHQTHESGGSLLIPDVGAHAVSRQALIAADEGEKEKKEEKQEDKKEEKKEEKKEKTAEPRKSCWLTRNEAVLGSAKAREDEKENRDGDADEEKKEAAESRPKKKAEKPGASTELDGSGDKKRSTAGSASWGKKRDKESEEKLPALDATDHASWPDIRSGSLRQSRGQRGGAAAPDSASAHAERETKASPSVAERSSSRGRPKQGDDRPRGECDRREARASGACPTPALSTTTAPSTAREDGAAAALDARVSFGTAQPLSSLASPAVAPLLSAGDADGASQRGAADASDGKSECALSPAPASSLSFSSLGERRGSLAATTTASARGEGEGRSRSGQRQESQGSQDSELRGTDDFLRGGAAPPSEETGDRLARRERDGRRDPRDREDQRDREREGEDRTREARDAERHGDAASSGFPEPSLRDRLPAVSPDAEQSQGSFPQSGTSEARAEREDPRPRGPGGRDASAPCETPSSPLACGEPAQQEVSPGVDTCPFPPLSSSYAFSSPASRVPPYSRGCVSSAAYDKAENEYPDAQRHDALRDGGGQETGRGDLRFAASASPAHLDDAHVSGPGRSGPGHPLKDASERGGLEERRKGAPEVNGVTRGSNLPYEERENRENVGFSSSCLSRRASQGRREASPPFHARAEAPTDARTAFYGAYPLEPPGLETAGAAGRRRSAAKGNLAMPEMEGAYGSAVGVSSANAESYAPAQFEAGLPFPAYARRDGREGDARSWRGSEREEKKRTLSDVFAALPPEAQQAAADAFASELAARREAERSRGREGQDPAKTEAEAARAAFLSVLAQASFEDRGTSASGETRAPPPERDLAERGYPPASVSPESRAGLSSGPFAVSSGNDGEATGALPVGSRLFPDHGRRDDRGGGRSAREETLEKDPRGETGLDGRLSGRQGLPPEASSRSRHPFPLLAPGPSQSGGPRPLEPWWGDGEFDARRGAEKADPFSPFFSRMRDQERRESEDLLPSLSSLLTPQTQGSAFYGLQRGAGEGMREATEAKAHAYAVGSWGGPHGEGRFDPRAGRSAYASGLFEKSDGSKGGREESLRLEFSLSSAEGRSNAHLRAAPGSGLQGQDSMQLPSSTSSFPFSFFPEASPAIYAGSQQRRVSGSSQAPPLGGKRDDLRAGDLPGSLSLAQRQQETGRSAAFSPVIQPAAPGRGPTAFSTKSAFPAFSESDYVSRLKANTQGPHIAHNTQSEGDDRRLPQGPSSPDDSRLAARAAGPFPALSASVHSVPQDAFAFAPLPGRKDASPSPPLYRGYSDSLSNGLDGEGAAGRGDGVSAYRREGEEGRAALSLFAAQFLQQNSVSRGLASPGAPASRDREEERERERAGENEREGEREEVAFLRLLRGRHGEGDGGVYGASARAEKGREGPFPSLAFDVRGVGQEPRGHRSPEGSRLHSRGDADAYDEARGRTPEDERRRFLGSSAHAPSQLLWAAQKERDQGFPSLRGEAGDARDFLRDNWPKSEKNASFFFNAALGHDGVSRGFDRVPVSNENAHKSAGARSAYAFDSSANAYAAGGMGLLEREGPVGRERERDTAKERDSGCERARKAGDAFFFASLSGSPATFHSANDLPSRDIHYMEQ
ncbi:conserved hypothetical protein [Neospora caninum Liverpool]|uniref:Leucine rich repeat protein n=1 Tax=Neospora caninum (strain Liverpool) TaxID=572307 RepID=F0VKT7_NEOCL|nr:conserved hypothetical protein [Neospora caninum Liverpool]CBZ54688.1 conserved hypothetical protein [Neospora caninum Liverpool]CEL69404.1 TPA: hypothetical protein BN1204_051150 [Neospora caninum Liverpool]|eukprot:XP_003884718.1 conserved hypothetical protein [Neospora caninum Liverpool]